VKEDISLPFLELLPDGSYRSVLVKTSITGRRRDALVEAARRGEELDPASARPVRVIEYDIPDRDGEGELIALVTTIADWTAAPAPVLAGGYHERWEHETANAQVKSVLRGPGRILRSGSPALSQNKLNGIGLRPCGLAVCHFYLQSAANSDRKLAGPEARGHPIFGWPRNAAHHQR